MIALWLLPFAHAAGYSLDIELLRPTLSPNALPGVEAPDIVGKGAWHLNTQLQWERAPLTLYQGGIDVGPVIGGRSTLDIGAGYDVSDRFSLYTTLPLSVQGGSDTFEFSADGAGTGDLLVGGRLHLVDVNPLRSAAYLNLLLPTNVRESWRGEVVPRAMLGVLLGADVWRVSGLMDIGTMIRKPVPTGEDLNVGSELIFNAGIAYNVYRDRMLVFTSLDGRSGISSLFKGGGESAAELLWGMRFQSNEKVHTDIFMGSGLSEGYGTSDFRIGMKLAYNQPPPKIKPQPVVIDVRPPPPDISELPPEPEPEPVVVWKPQELARLEQDQIVIRDPIQFEFGKDIVLPVSLPILDQVAKILEDHPELLHVVIEGHASEEGSYIYNYDLSLRRANAIWRELVARGVHPDRLSTRSMGEVEPIDLGTDEAALAKNRRVVFQIINRWEPGDPEPVYSTHVRQPWTGDPQPITPLPPMPQPTPVAPPPVPEPGKVDPSIFRPDDDEQGDPKESP